MSDVGHPGRSDNRDDTDGPDLDVPEWDDEYLDRVSDRLMFHYDLEKNSVVRGERFDLFGSMLMETQKQFMHRSINYANHHAKEYLFARRVDTATIAELERLVELGHELADLWVEPSPEHFGTDFTFVLVAPDVPEDVHDFVSDFADRTLIKFGYYGHVEMNVAVVAPDDEAAIASRNADSVDAFTLWTDISPTSSKGVVQRLVERLRR
ncbi:hypothetical protein GJR96_05540 [Haloferax sp. MBLA0076]|uniref:DUF8052 domain-containing protein n=1 Tax=Haloferax litoreum TaxID=2666140 RepID=A0A6A8GE18_9EURY|nr:MULTISPECIES: hypothetical protein [Haloferax]KAB1192936.1 hypothetical protein Hfx1148_05535 [Haloferax sp. CBA1148]MRX21423.1 hypothetical protein [Haloferax litoreum]